MRLVRFFFVWFFKLGWVELLLGERRSRGAVGKWFCGRNIWILEIGLFGFLVVLFMDYGL